MKKIQNLDELKEVIFDLFKKIAQPGQFHPINDHQLSFIVEGKLKKLVSQLQEETGQDGWDGGSTSKWFVNKVGDYSILLNSVPGGVLVFCSILSILGETLDRHG